GPRASRSARQPGRGRPSHRGVGPGRTDRTGAVAREPVPAAVRQGRIVRALPLIPIVVLAGLPVAIHPTSGFLGGASVGGSLCAAGALVRWRPLITVGATLTMIQYAFALMGARSSLVSAITLGVCLTLVLDVFEFVGRFRGAAVTAPALYRQARHWMASAL